ncbi:MAG: hypothetical protein Q3971_04570, partial [Moraxella sp.]|nr:hypothetical protein [Moraxella sp.]
LFFTKVLDENKFELDEDDIVLEPKDRNYWENKASANSLKLVDKIMSTLGDVVSEYELKYNKHYIGIANKHSGMANNFILFKARKDTVLFYAKMSRSDDIDNELDNFDYLSYDRGSYRIRIKEKDLSNPQTVEFLKRLTQIAKNEY